MGHRANMVIIREGDWQLYYDHWIANHLDIELFWGPESTEALIRQRPPKADRHDWLDAVWCEGGVLLDHDRRHLLWFGGGDMLHDVPFRRSFLALMDVTWEGWSVQWASSGVADLGGYLGFPIEQFVGDHAPDDADRFTVFPDPLWNDFLLTIEVAGRTTAARISGDDESLELGSSFLGDLLAVSTRDRLDWKGDMPTGGLHLRPEEQSMAYWLAQGWGGLSTRVRGAWPGWEIHDLGDRYEHHLGMVRDMALHLPQRSHHDLQAEHLDRLRKGMHREAKNPVEDLLPLLKGNTASINPLTEETRGSVGSVVDKHRLLEDLANRLPIGDVNI